MNLRESLPHFLGNPIYGFAVSLASLIGIPLTVFLYFQGQQSRDLVFTVHPARTIIARAGRPSDLKVEFKGNAINTDVVGVQVALWNQGKGSVHAGDVLSPIEIRLNPPAAILEASIAKTSRDVIALTLDRNVEVLRHGRIPVSFRVLEQGDGGSIQVIYAGPPDVDVSIVGVVEGAGAPRHLRATVESPPLERRTPSFAERTFRKVFPWILAIAIVGISLQPAVSILTYVYNPEGRNNSRLVFDCLQLSLYLVMACLWFFIVPWIPTPPFGF